jgi:hypothetical protein
MKDKRLSLLLLGSSILLLLVSFGLLCAWGYYYFYEKKPVNAKIEAPVTDSLAMVNSTRDSLSYVYNSTISGLNNPVDSIWNNPDHQAANLDSKLSEYYKLRSEIGILLKNNSTSNDLDSARQKIAALQQKIEELRNRTVAVETENKRLTEMVRQLNTKLKVNTKPEIRNTGGEKMSTSSSSAALSPNFSASELKLYALCRQDGQTKETSEAGKAEELSGSFVIRNNYNSLSSSNVYVIVIRPDGRVLQNSDWESGAFDTQEGRKIYSTKIHFDYTKGEGKKLSFSIQADDLEKGEYILQVYHNGVLIGKATRTLL